MSANFLNQNGMRSEWVQHVGYFTVPTSRFYKTVDRFADKIGLMFDLKEPQYSMGMARLALSVCGKERGLVEIQYPNLLNPNATTSFVNILSQHRDNEKVLAAFNSVVKISHLTFPSICLQPQMAINEEVKK